MMDRMHPLGTNNIQYIVIFNVLKNQQRTKQAQISSTLQSPFYPLHCNPKLPRVATTIMAIHPVFVGVSLSGLDEGSTFQHCPHWR